MKKMAFLACVFLAGAVPFYGEMDSEDEIHRRPDGEEMSPQEKYGQTEDDMKRIRLQNEADAWRKKNCGEAENLWEAAIKAKDDIIESDRQAYDRFEQANKDYEVARAELDAAKTRALPASSGERQDPQAIKAHLKPYQRRVYLARVEKDNAYFLFRKIRKIRKAAQNKFKEDEKLYKPVEVFCQKDLESISDADLTLVVGDLEYFKHGYSQWNREIAAPYLDYLECERDVRGCRGQQRDAEAREAAETAPGGLHHN